MNYFKSSLQAQRNFISQHPVATGIVLLIAATTLFAGHKEGFLAQALAYLFGVWLCIVIVDAIVTANPVQEEVFVIKRPLRTELFLIVSCTLLGVIFFCIRFFSDWEHLQGLLRLLAISLIVFAFPVVLALVFLFVFKYKFKDLGVNLNYWYLPILLHLIWGALTLSMVPEKSHFSDAVKEYGVLGFIVTGILGAALSEEFVRMLFQTRIGKITNNMFTGIFVASVIWSAMHIPVAYSQDPSNFGFTEALLGVVCLVPLGLFWGFLTHRTQSLLPVILMHGFNLWGLQNF